MPYKSDAQRRYFNANREKLEEQGVDVDEWNESSKGKKLPEKVKEKKANINPMINMPDMSGIYSQLNQLAPQPIMAGTGPAQNYQPSQAVSDMNQTIHSTNQQMGYNPYGTGMRLNRQNPYNLGTPQQRQQSNDMINQMNKQFNPYGTGMKFGGGLGGFSGNSMGNNWSMKSPGLGADQMKMAAEESAALDTKPSALSYFPGMGGFLSGIAKKTPGVGRVTGTLGEGVSGMAGSTVGTPLGYLGGSALGFLLPLLFRRGRGSFAHTADGIGPSHIGALLGGAGGGLAGNMYGTHKGSEIFRELAAKPEKSAAAVEKLAKLVAARCWEGYEPVPGKKPYSEDSCRPAGSGDKKSKAKEKKAFAGLTRELNALQSGLQGAGLGARFAPGALAGGLVGGAKGLMEDPGYDPKTGKKKSKLMSILKNVLGGGVAGGAATTLLGAPATRLGANLGYSAGDTLSRGVSAVREKLSSSCGCGSGKSCECGKGGESKCSECGEINCHCQKSASDVALLGKVAAMQEKMAFRLLPGRRQQQQQYAAPQQQQQYAAPRQQAAPQQQSPGYASVNDFQRPTGPLPSDRSAAGAAAWQAAPQGMTRMRNDVTGEVFYAPSVEAGRQYMGDAASAAKYGIKPGQRVPQQQQPAAPQVSPAAGAASRGLGLGVSAVGKGLAGLAQSAGQGLVAAGRFGNETLEASRRAQQLNAIKMKQNEPVVGPFSGTTAAEKAQAASPVGNTGTIYDTYKGYDARTGAHAPKPAPAAPYRPVGGGRNY